MIYSLIKNSEKNYCLTVSTSRVREGGGGLIPPADRRNITFFAVTFMVLVHLFMLLFHISIPLFVLMTFC